MGSTARPSATMPAFALACMLSGVSAWVPGAAAPARAEAPRDAERLGTYRADDGLCVTGGRFDESGARRLLYMDVAGNRLGGLFEWMADENGLHASLLVPDAGLHFDDGGAVLDWLEAGTRALALRRVHAPLASPVSFPGGEATLAGTLYRPDVDPDVELPAIVLVHGSGPQDRHAGPWTTFFVDLGMAVLSYDKRGAGDSGGRFEPATFDDLAADLSAAVDWLARQPGIDATRIGLHGSSQAGWYAPRVARDNPRVAFMVMRAAPALPVSLTTRHERVEEWKAAGATAAQAGLAGRFWESLVDLAASGASLEEAQARLDAARAETWFADTFGDWDAIDADWWRREQVDAGYRPLDDLAARPLPTLWFLATADENVPFETTLRALRGLERPESSLEIVTVAGADHAFLLRDASGVRYTNRYWPDMAHWLAARGFEGPATPAAACVHPEMPAPDTGMASN